MRLCLLAVGALTGAPSLSWGFHADAKASLMGVGSALALMTDETPKASLSMLAPSVSSASFVAVAAPSLPRLQPAQYSMRRAIAQRLAKGHTPATEQMMKKISPPVGARPSVAQPPSIGGRPTAIVGRPPSVTPGVPAPPPLPAPSAAGMTPAGRLLFRRGAVRRPEAAIKPPVGAAAPKATPATPVSPGAILSRYVRSLRIGGEKPSEEAPKEELSEEELAAAKKAIAEQEEQFKKEIVQAVTANIADAEQRKGAARAKAPESPVKQATMEALTSMTGGRSGTTEVILRGIKEVTTGKQLVAECLGKQIKILGMGGMGVVVQVDILDEACKKALEMDRVALKVMYLDLEGKTLSDSQAQLVYQRLETLFDAETKPLKRMGAAAKPGQSVPEMLKNNHWAVPAYSAFAGEVNQVFIFNGLLFTPYVLLSKLMLGDGLQLIYNKGVVPASPIPMPVREFVCGELIKSTAKLHGIGLAHYDIKPDNILLGSDGSVNLADFGMCGPINVPKACGEGITTLYTDPAQATCLRKGGSLSMTPKYDSWSVGMTCYLIITARGFPYRIRNSPELLQHISSLSSRPFFRAPPQYGNPEEELKQAGASSQWARIVSDLLIIPRDKRPTPQDILKKYPNWKYGTGTD
ncbi:hypothetical protein Emag_001196 [Eimeria magna]